MQNRPGSAPAQTGGSDELLQGRRGGLQVPRRGVPGRQRCGSRRIEPACGRHRASPGLQQPTSSITVVLKEPAIEVIEGDSDLDPDVRMSMSADHGNQFWRGEYNVAVGLAKGQVKAKGPVTKILKLIPAAKPVFPIYRDLVGEKDVV